MCGFYIEEKRHKGQGIGSKIITLDSGEVAFIGRKNPRSADTPSASRSFPTERASLKQPRVMPRGSAQRYSVPAN
jgi:hypothetical protein